MGNQSEYFAVAIDIGGTYVKAGLISQSGILLALQRKLTPENAAPEVIVNEIICLTNELVKEAKVSFIHCMGMGISIAAFITADGIVTATAHLSKNWLGYDLKHSLSGTFPIEMYFSLDTPAPTLGEAYFGAGIGCENFVYVTVSTGIGAGIMDKGKYFAGGLGWAGGVGHIIIDETSDRICSGCGNHGCLETFSAHQGIIRTAWELIVRNPTSLLAQLATRNPDELSPKLVFEAACQKDETAIKVFQIAGHALGVGLTNLVDILSPQKIVIGGGIALSGDLLLDPVRKVILERAFPPKNREVMIEPAALKDLSGMYGAAALVFNKLRIN